MSYSLAHPVILLLLFANNNKYFSLITVSTIIKCDHFRSLILLFIVGRKYTYESWVYFLGSLDTYNTKYQSLKVIFYVKCSSIFSLWKPSRFSYLEVNAHSKHIDFLIKIGHWVKCWKHTTKLQAVSIWWFIPIEETHFRTKLQNKMSSVSEMKSFS